MHYTETRLLGVRQVVVLVERWQLAAQHADPLIFELQQRFAAPAMLVARDDENWMGVRAYAHLDAMPYLEALLSLEEIDWRELPPPPEPELPF